MKKIYFLAGILAFTGSTFAQLQQNVLPMAQSKNSPVPNNKKYSMPQTKAEGDVYYTNNFSTSTDWTHVSGTNHTAGNWQIVNAVPASLVSQAPTYGFPVAMNSASGGNFAFINSDAAGAGAVQDAYLVNTTAIDLSTAANASLYLNFTEIYRHFQETFSVEVSNDNGATWTIFPVNPVSEVPVNTNSADPEYETVNISSAKGPGAWTNQVFVRFHYVGTYDWFWGIDDVSITEAWENEIRLANYYQATDITTTNGLDYYFVDDSQTSFPGLTFGAIAQNNGSITQNDVALHVTCAAAAYDETSAPITLAQGQMDTLSISTPMMLGAVGTYVVDVETSMAATDAVPANNTEQFTMYKHVNWYGRDNDMRTGSISNVTSNPDGELSIGNLMDIYNTMTVTAMRIRLDLQAAGAVGSEFQGEIYLFDGTDFQLFASTELGTITSTTAGWAQLKFPSAVTLNQDDLVLVCAKHYGGTDEIRFSYAQDTYEQTVQGFIADGSGFSLTQPGAIMVRLSDDPTVGIEESEELSNVSIYPNPTSGVITIANLDNLNSTITISDMTGKVVLTSNTSNDMNVDLSTFGQGVYVVKVTNNDGQKIERVVVR